MDTRKIPAIRTAFRGCCVLLLAFLCLPAQAKLYKWVDDKGETHYGETIPPEYANRSNVLLNEQGRVLKKNDKASPDELRATREAASRKRAEDEAAAAQKRKDKTLLSTYTTESEIDLARDRNLEQVTAVVNSMRTLLESAETSLEGYQQEAEQRTAAGKAIPASLNSDIADAEIRVAKLRHDLAKATEKYDAVRASYDADKIRFRALKGGTASSQNPPLP